MTEGCAIPDYADALRWVSGLNAESKVVSEPSIQRVLECYRQESSCHEGMVAAENLFVPSVIINENTLHGAGISIDPDMSIVNVLLAKVRVPVVEVGKSLLIEVFKSKSIAFLPVEFVIS